jgi:type IV pilus assembly protein PilF
MKFIRFFIIVLLFGLSACVSQNSGTTLDDFDKQKAAKTRLSLGLTYLKNGNFSQAKFNLDKALSFAPDLADVHYGMAYYFQNVEVPELASKSYQKAISLAPKNADIANSYGAFLCSQGDYEQAKEYFFKALNSDVYNSSAETYENLAMCSQSQKAFDDAIGFLKDALNHQPGRAKSLFLLAQVQLQANRFAAARDSLRRYEKVAPVSAESLWLAVKIEEGAGAPKRATDYANMLLSLYPDFQPARDYINGIDSPHTLEPVVNTPAVKPTNDVVKDNLPSSHYHVVTAKENLYRLSLQYNVKMSKLMEWNNISDPASIYIGQKLIVVEPK